MLLYSGQDVAIWKHIMQMSTGVVDEHALQKLYEMAILFFLLEERLFHKNLFYILND